MSRYNVNTEKSINEWYGYQESEPRDQGAEERDQANESRDQGNNPLLLLETEVGYWDEEELDGVDLDILTLPSMQ